MARDFKHGVGHKETYKRKSQMKLAPPEAKKVYLSASMLWLLAMGLSLSFIIGFWVVEHFAVQGVQGSKLVTAAVAPTVESAVEKATNLSNPPAVSEPIIAEAEQVDQKPVNYTFYHGLAETEVLVDAEPISVQLTYYTYVQAGSFGSKAIAQKEQARLKNKGFDLELSALTTDVRTYYRLRLGPFSDRLEMNKQRNALREFGVDTLRVRTNRKVAENLPSEADEVVQTE